MQAQPSSEPALWRSRLRWRLKGAWLGPAFVLGTLAETVLLMQLPIAGENGADLVPAFLACAFINLAIVGFCAPVGALVLRRRRPAAMPQEVWRDRVGTAALATFLVFVLTAGLLHRDEVSRAQDDFGVQLQAARAFFAHQGPAEAQGKAGQEDVWKQGPGLYRTCVPGEQPRRAYCVIVDTANGIPTVAEDPDQQPNNRIAGSDNPGRKGG